MDIRYYNKIDEIEDGYLEQQELQQELQYNKLKLLRTKILSACKYCLLVEYILNLFFTASIFGLLVKDKKMALYVSFLFVSCVVRLMINYSLKFRQNQAAYQTSIYNQFHTNNIRVSSYYIVLFVVLIVYGSIITQGDHITSYYIAKVFNINMLLTEIIKIVGLMCGTDIEEYGGYEQYLLYLIL